MILEQAASWAGGALILAGAFFYVVGAVGLVRMPDLFTRLHGASVLETLGAGLLLTGMMFAGGFTLVTVKLAIILGVIIFTAPVATHALAQAALHDGLEPRLASDTVLGEPPRRQSGSKTPPARPAAARKQAARRDAARGKGRGGTSKR